MPRPRPSRKSKPEPEPEIAPDPVDDAPPAEAAPVSKAQAVRDALAEGIEGLGDIDAFVRSRYGLEISRPMISAYKSQALGKRQGVAKASRATSDARPSRKASGGGGEADLLATLQALKPLVVAFGAERVKRLADLLG